MNGPDRVEGVPVSAASFAQGSRSSAQPEAAAQWAQSIAEMQALYKQNAPAAPPFMPPGQLAAYYANAAQFTPLLYNAHMMNGLGGIANPYAFMPGAMPQSQKNPAGEQPFTRHSADQDSIESQEGATQKRQRQDKPRTDSKVEDDEPSRVSDSPSPASEPGSEQLNSMGGAMLAGEGDPQLGIGLVGTSNSAQNLAANGAPGLQDEREVKKLRRKQSNRESARRSRLRKQAECEALSGRVLELQQENLHLKEANRALLSRVEELVAKLEQRPEPQAVKPGDSAFTPVMPSGRLLQQLPAEGSNLPAPSNPSQPSTQSIESNFAVLEPQQGDVVTRS